MDKDFIKIFQETKALMHGHFILSSGLHSDTYFQCAKVLQYPEHLSMFGTMLSDHFSDLEIDKVISPVPVVENELLVERKKMVRNNINFFFTKF